MRIVPIASKCVLILSMTMMLPATAREQLLGDPESAQAAFVLNAPGEVMAQWKGVVIVRRSNGTTETHTFGEAGRDHDLARFSNEKALLESKPTLSQDDSRRVRYLGDVVAALRASKQKDQASVNAKGTVQGSLCSSFSYELSAGPAQDTAGYFTLARAEIELAGPGPFPEGPFTTAYANATAYCSVDEVQVPDSDSGVAGSFAESKAYCGNGETFLGWEGYLLVEAFIEDVRCSYRGYNPDGPN